MLRFRALALVVLATACATGASTALGGQTPVATAAAPPAHTDGIAWYEGDVRAAFRYARAGKKPVFVYWGAEWCPPCQQVKATLFRRREFIERTRLLVPVYLDGDSQSAQKYGEQFGVVGYPTMILFRPDGTEIMRLPGGVDIELYDTVLDSALKTLRPMTEIVAAAKHDPASLTPGDWKLLAFYSWETGEQRIVSDADRQVLLEQLLPHCPATVEADCVRLKLSLAALVAQAKDPPRVKLDQRDLLATLNEVLGKPELRPVSLDYMLYAADDLVKVATQPNSTERKALVATWKSTLTQIANDESVSKADRVATGYARVALAKLDAGDNPLPADVLALARERAAWGDRVTTDAYERQSVINVAGNLLAAAGLDADANALLTRELARSKSPYYFMLDIADLAQKAGHKELALHWLERAYNESRGPATRFQWGTNYLLGLIEMAPGDGERIERVGLDVLGELGRDKDGIYQRSRIRLERIDTAMREWNRTGKHTPVIEALRGRLSEVCTPVAAGDSARKACDQFLAKA